MTTYTNKKLVLDLNSLIAKYGFSDVLSVLEAIASNNADFMGSHWETIRQNLDDSFLEAEEYLLTANFN